LGNWQAADVPLSPKSGTPEELDDAEHWFD